MYVRTENVTRHAWISKQGIIEKHIASTTTLKPRCIQFSRVLCIEYSQHDNSVSVAWL
jgi:hypothetical protein